jgi:hypothetical protein
MISSPLVGAVTAAKRASVPSLRKRATSSGFSTASRARNGACAPSRSSADWRQEASSSVIAPPYHPRHGA